MLTLSSATLKERANQRSHAAIETTKRTKHSKLLWHIHSSLALIGLYLYE